MEERIKWSITHVVQIQSVKTVYGYNGRDHPLAESTSTHLAHLSVILLLASQQQSSSDYLDINSFMLCFYNKFFAIHLSRVFTLLWRILSLSLPPVMSSQLTSPPLIVHSTGQSSVQSNRALILWGSRSPSRVFIYWGIFELIRIKTRSRMD